jgi:hypothetical protein
MQALLACVLATVPQPVFMLGPDAVLDVAGARLLPGTAIIRSPKGTALDFDGDHCGIELPDAAVFRMTGSLSISCWLNLRSYITPQNSARGSQILFRGDDRSGLDAYHLTVLEDGTIAIAVENEAGGAFVGAPIDLRRWTHVLGTFDAKTGALRMYLDGRLAAFTTTKVTPLKDLDQGSRPGIGIGNVQASSGGAHNQPLNGQICDLRLYDQAVTPRDAGYPPVMFLE